MVDFAPGMRTIIRDEEWMIKKIETNSLGNKTLYCVGVSPLVKDREAIFLADLEQIQVVDPAEVKLVADHSPFYKRALLYLESQWRQQIPTDSNLHIGHRAAMDLMPYQLDPAKLSLQRPRQRILIADTVGLGKTLEAGILMSELIARGKGKRILVVTVKSMMTQFQKEMIKELENKPKDSSHDEEIKELKSEESALLTVLQEIGKKNTFNFLSDEGLLPNYAFPEAGIILRAILYRKEEEEVPTQKKKYEKMVYEYSRSASSAISEFAPNNSFYVDGRKLTIDQVDLTTAQTARWRLCPNCSHAQIEETGKNTSACPQCGSPGWADAGQVRTMLKVQMVYSNMDYTKSLINDESDDRSNVFYCKQLLVDVDEGHDISSAYRMDNED